MYRAVGNNKNKATFYIYTITINNNSTMKTNNMMKAACLMLMASATTSAFEQKMHIAHKGDTTIIKVENPTKYLLLPIQEEKDEAQVLLDTGSKDDTWMDVQIGRASCRERV